jgi:hypothetical protein
MKAGKNKAYPEVSVTICERFTPRDRAVFQHALVSRSETEFYNDQTRVTPEEARLLLKRLAYRFCAGTELEHLVRSRNRLQKGGVQ